MKTTVTELNVPSAEIANSLTPPKTVAAVTLAGEPEPAEPIGEIRNRLFMTQITSLDQIGETYDVFASRRAEALKLTTESIILSEQCKHSA